MKVFGIVGYSGSGKTTLLRRLIPELVGRGLSIATVKHTHHRVTVDAPGDPGFEARARGAIASLVAGPERWYQVNAVDPERAIDLAQVVAPLAPADLVLIEGFKRYPHAKLEVHRAQTGKPLWRASDPQVVAVASDHPLPDLDCPWLALDDVKAIADFILAHPGSRP
ncbi:MAG: molybdopterin-guanine dinucleotide biosynthesis protein B [Rhodospirillales bacterium]|nr:molybdopterin-guanine dinucleotide biosynthesis protein B [Rhodospirillales bacterium]